MGRITATTLLAELLELGKLVRKKIAALAGTHERRQWQEARVSQDQGRESGSAECVVRVDLGGDQIQPGDPSAVSGIIEEGKVKKVALTAVCGSFYRF